MRKRSICMLTGTVILLSVANLVSLTAQATGDSMNQNGSVIVEGSKVSDPIDPENPTNPVDPGPSPSTEGPLRIDYVSALNFGQSVIKKKNRDYYALAQQFHSNTDPRGSYIQITDQRATSTGWSLQVKQETQFKNSVIQTLSEQELNGAVLSLDKGWSNSSSSGEGPTVTRETLALDIGVAYQVANATAGAGRGVWTIEFGASSTNKNNQENTLTPLKDSKNKSIVDPEYQKPAYSNSAIKLSIPEKTKIYPVQYETTITWLLAELP